MKCRNCVDWYVDDDKDMWEEFGGVAFGPNTSFSTGYPATSPDRMPAHAF